MTPRSDPAHAEIAESVITSDPASAHRTDAEHRAQEQQSVVFLRKHGFRTLFIVLSVTLLAWLVLVARAAYNFRSAQAHAVGESYLDHLHQMLTRVPNGTGHVLFLLFFLFSAIGPGDLILRPLKLDWHDAGERTLCAVATGLIAFTFGILVIGSAGLLQFGICLAFLGIACALTLWYLIGIYRSTRAEHTWNRDRFRTLFKEWRTPRVALGILLALILVVFLYVALLGAITPEVGFDARWYHLSQARAYAQHGRIYNFIKETRITAAAVDPYQSILYAVLWKMAGMIGAKLLSWCDAFLTVLALIYFCRFHFRSTLMGLLAGLMYASIPLIAWSTSTAGNDLPLALYTLLGVHALLRWKEARTSWQWLVVVGLFGGYAVGIKTSGLFSLLLLLAAIPFFIFTGWLAERRESFLGIVRQAVKCLAVAAVAAVIACVPWLGRSYVETGNPTFPQLNGIFHSPYVNEQSLAEESNQYWSSVIKDRSPGAILALPWDTVAPGKNDYKGILGPVFLFVLPISLALMFFTRGRQGRTLRFVGAFALLWVGLWLASRYWEIRYLIPMTPLLAVLAAFPLVWHQRAEWWSAKIFRAALWLGVLAITILNFQPFVLFQRMTTLPSLSFSSVSYVAWSYLYTGVPDPGVQAQESPVLHYINANLSPESDKVYDASGIVIASAYSRVPIFNGSGYDGPAGMHQWDLSNADAFQHLQAEHVTYVYIANLPALEPQMAQRPIWAHLRPVWRSSDRSEALFWLAP